MDPSLDSTSRVFVRRARLRALLERAESSAGNARAGWIRVLNDPEDGDVHVIVWSIEGLVALDFDHGDPASVLAHPARRAP